MHKRLKQREIINLIEKIKCWERKRNLHSSRPNFDNFTSERSERSKVKSVQEDKRYHPGERGHCQCGTAEQR